MYKITKAANLEPEDLNELMFDDDQCMVNNETAQLQDNMEHLSSYFENYNMRDQHNKDMSGCTTGNLSTSISRKFFYQTVEYKYLGSIFSESWKMNREIEVRIQRANSVIYQLSPLLQHCKIPMEMKAKLINSIFLPTLTYQCKTWTLNRDLKRKVTTCEMRCLKRAAGKTRWEKIRMRKLEQWSEQAPS